MDVTAQVKAALNLHPLYAGQICHIEELPGSPGRQAALSGLGDPISAWLARRGLKLWEHQARAFRAFRDGANVVIATGTASGKSLAFNLCVAERLLANPSASALYLYPTKALARDQLATLEAMDREIGLGALPAVYDGDTPASERRRIREFSRLVLTNPYALHLYLAQPRYWSRLLGSLEVVVLDEIHHYRGVFGANVAYLLRRLERLASRQGAEIRFVAASATVANPRRHAENLCARAFEIVSEDTSLRPPREVILFDTARDPNRSLLSQAAWVVACLANAGLTSLCFVGSRKAAELVNRWTQEHVPHRSIAVYRAGLSRSERRFVESALQSGQLDAVVSTNALELGIDMGEVDVVVVAGYPGTISSTWQQIGRAGRRGRSAAAVVLLGDDPLDGYIARRPQVLFGSPLEEAVLPLQNPIVLAGQLACAAAETPLSDEELKGFGPGAEEQAEKLLAAGRLARLPGKRLGYAGTSRPHDEVSLGRLGVEEVRVEVDAETVEILELERALRDAHPGAIFYHSGLSYEVTSLDLDARRASARPIDTRDHTRPLLERTWSLGEPSAARNIGCFRMHLGPAKIATRVVASRRYHFEELVEVRRLHLPQVVLDTRAIWLVPEQDLLKGATEADLLSGLHGAEHALIQATGLLAMSDPREEGGISTTFDAALGSPMILLYDGEQGGSGVAEMVFERMEELAETALGMLEACDCESGCPRCVFDRNCGSDNQDLDRYSAIVILRRLVSRQGPLVR